MDGETTYTAFLGNDLLASGALGEILAALKARFDQDSGAPVLTFEDQTGKQVDFDLRGMLSEVLERHGQLAPFLNLVRHAPGTLGDALARSVMARPKLGPGRPKLGVVAREISLLPRHWEWLAAQPGGASVALRKLVEAASRDPKAERMAARDAAYRFASAMGGDEAGFEEAMRALYAGKRKKFRRQLETWPPDVREHLEKMAAAVFESDDEDS